MISSLSRMSVDDPNSTWTQQQEVLMLIPSCVAAVDVVINGQALSTQAQRSALTHFAICSLLDLLLLHQLCLWARGRALFQVRFFQVPTLMPFPIRVHKLLSRRGDIHPTLFRNSRPKFDMEATRPFQQDNLIITPPCAAAFGTTEALVNLRVLVL